MSEIIKGVLSVVAFGLLYLCLPLATCFVVIAAIALQTTTDLLTAVVFLLVDILILLIAKD